MSKKSHQDHFTQEIIKKDFLSKKINLRKLARYLKKKAEYEPESKNFISSRVKGITIKIFPNTIQLYLHKEKQKPEASLQKFASWLKGEWKWLREDIERFDRLVLGEND